MITDKVIKEIYEKFNKPPKDPAELELDKYFDMLKAHHRLREENGEVFIDDLEEFNPFRRFLKRAICGVLEFDKMIAIVFKRHILFLSKYKKDMRVHIKPEKKPSLLSRIFGKKS